MNVEQRQAAVDPQTKPPDLGCESACTGTTVGVGSQHSKSTPLGVMDWRSTCDTYGSASNNICLHVDTKLDSFSGNSHWSARWSNLTDLSQSIEKI